MSATSASQSGPDGDGPDPLAQQALRQSEAHLRTLADLVPDLLWRNDARGHVDWFNRRWSDYTGQDPQQALGLGWLDAIHPEDRPASWRDWHQAMQVQACFFAEHRIRRHDGAWRWHFVRSEPCIEDDGHVEHWFGAATEVHELRLAQQQLQQRVQQRTAELHALLDAAASAIVATDADGRVTLFNAAAERLLGLSAAQARGRALLEFLVASELRADAHWLPAPLVQALLPEGAAGAAGDRRGSHRSEFTCVRADGTRLPTLVNWSVLHDAQGTPSGFMAVLTDLSERKAMEEQLRQRTRQAEAASLAKSDFLTRMSHEIRTPLNGLLGTAGLLRQTALTEAQRRLLDIQERAGRSLLALINDLLDLAKIEAGKVQLEAEPFELGEPVQQALELVRPLAQHKGLALHGPEPPLPAHPVRGDAARLRQVLLNLLSNAVKFTPAGHVRLELRVLDGGDPLRVRLAVHDSGIGIAPELHARLFQPFEQADSATTRQFGGTGLGLAISHHLVELMGGRLEVDSRPGATTFAFELALPRAAAPAAAAPVPHDTAAGATARPLRVLLAEDDAVNQLVVRTMLEGAGHEVTVVDDGEQAVQAAAAQHFDVVLMDVRMPVLDGLQATRRIRALPAPHGAVPVIGLTAEALAPQVQQCLASGMDRVLTKPCEQAALLEAVQAVAAAAQGPGAG